MLDSLKKIFSVQSLVTLILTVVFSYLAVIDKVSSQEFMTIFTVIIAFYFGSQVRKTE